MGQLQILDSGNAHEGFHSVAGPLPIGRRQDCHSSRCCMPVPRSTIPLMWPDSVSGGAIVRYVSG